MGRQSNHTVSCDLKGLELMLNLKEISIECCLSELWHSRDDVHVEMTEMLVTEEGDRWIDVSTVIKDESYIDWDEPAIEVYDFPVSMLQTLVIYPKSPPTLGEDQDDVITRTLRFSQAATRLHYLRSLSILGAEILVESLGRILRKCPELELLEVALCFTYAGWFPNGLWQYFERGHRLIDARIQGAELEWLPYLRSCRRLGLPSCRMCQQGFSPNSSMVAYVAAECTVPIDLEELMLDLIITDVRTCTEANSVIEFIKLNTTEQTRITITTSKDPRYSDSLGIPEIDASELSDDSDDSYDSDSNGHSPVGEKSADRGESADREGMTPEQRKEMRRAHKAILRYAASERARWS